jgi:hypothetical protein
MIEVLAKGFDHVVQAGIKLFLWVMNSLEGALREPLQSLGIHGALQTLILMMIPILMIVAVVKFFGGIIRAFVVVVLALVLAHVAYALFTGVPGQ